MNKEKIKITKLPHGYEVTGWFDMPFVAGTLDLARKVANDRRRDRRFFQNLYKNEIDTGLFEIEDFLGKDENYMITYYEKKGWIHRQSFHDYKFFLENEKIKKIMAVECDTVPGNDHFTVSAIELTDLKQKEII